MVFYESVTQNVGMEPWQVNAVTPGGRPHPKELHETSFHHQPKASWHVEDDSQEYEVKWDPLVVGIVHYCVVAVVL